MILENFEAVQITIIKRFKFLEPLFYPKNLRKEFRFLSNAEKTRKIINRMKRTKVGELGELKPIRNLNIPKDNFWRPFVLDPPTIKLTRQPLFYYPFQIVFDKKKTAFELNIEHLSNVFNFKIKDAKVAVQARLFPPGIGTLHLRLYLQPVKMDITALSKITSNKKNIKINYLKRNLGSLEFLDNIGNALIQKIVSNPSPIFINGHYTIYNFQGKQAGNTNAETLIKTLSGSGNSIPGNIMHGRSGGDLFYVSDRMAVMNIDAQLAKTRNNILSARRCFRRHFINSVELAYVNSELVKEYTKKSGRILQEIENAALDHNAINKIKNIFKVHVVNPGFFATLWSSVSRVHTMLEESNERWKDVYFAVASQLELEKELAKLDEASDKLFKQAGKSPGIFILSQGMYEELKFWIRSAIDGISVFK